MSDMNDAGTRRGRKSGQPVRPQKSTSVAWFETFLGWSAERQRTSIDALEALIITSRTRPVASQEALPEVVNEAEDAA